MHGGNLDQSMKEMAKARKTWQKKGIIVFESFYYTLGRFCFIFASLLLAQASQFLETFEDKDGRFANEWVNMTVFVNMFLLVDFILHMVFYGWRTIVALRKDYLWEGGIQIAFFISYILYFMRRTDDI